MSAAKVVLITGCSSGVGKSLAVLLAKSVSPFTYKVYATMRNLSKQQPLIDAAGDSYNRTLFVKQLDVCDETSVHDAVNAIVSTEGRIDVLVNNAGQGLSGPFDSQDWATIHNCLDINFNGVIRATGAVLPFMKKQESGQIINVSSVGGINGVPFNEIYCAAKFAVEGFSESLAPVLKAFNVKVNLIEPGPILTDFVHNANQLSEEAKARLDPKTIKIYETVSKNMLANFKPEYGQTGDQVAEIIQKNVIEAENPPLRLQTHAVFRPGDLKFTDPTGSDAMNIAFDRYLKGTF